MKALEIDKIRGINLYVDFGTDIILYCTRGTKTKADAIRYNKTTKRATLIPGMYDDISFNKNSGFSSAEFKCTDNKGMYNAISSFLFPRFLKAINSGGLKPTIDKFEELKELTEDSNPVIFYYEYK